jgi:glycosidase
MLGRTIGNRCVLKSNKIRGVTAILIAGMLTLSGCGLSGGGTAGTDGQVSSGGAAGTDGQVATGGDAAGTDSQVATGGDAAGTDSQGVTGAGAVDESGQVAAGNTAQQDEYLPPLNILDDKYRSTYEIFVYSFYDSDGDGIGDLKGVTEKLDYINDGDDSTDSDLGFNEIWLMPISPSPTYHKYDVTDYMDIDPEYGSLEDFDELIKECHDRGIRVIIDTVFNHSSVEHPWFTEAAEYLKSHPGITFLDASKAEKTETSTEKTENSAETAASSADKAETSADTTESSDTSTATAVPEKNLSECPYLEYYTFSNEKQAGFEPLPDTDYFYEARFWSGMPDLNLDSSAVRQELSKITDFWIKRGVDGFRLDATTFYYTGNDSKNIEFMTWLNDTVKSQNENSYIVGEAWVNSATYQKYYESGIDSFFDFDFAASEGIIASVVRGNSPAVRYSDSIAEAEEAIAQAGPGAIDAPFYTNHDIARSAGYYMGSGGEDKIKLAQGLNLLMAGNAFVYYGEELGMKGSGKDENKRAPMYWTASKDENSAKGMCKGPRAMDSFKMKYSAVDEQSADPYSIYNYVKRAVRLRNAYPVIARGRTATVSELSDKDICAFTRSVTEDEAKEYLEKAAASNTSNQGEAKDAAGFGPTGLLVVINTSAEAKTVDISKSSEPADYVTLSYELETAQDKCLLEGNMLTVPAYGIAVLTK